MEELGNHQVEGINNPVRRKRSHTFRRPRPDSQAVPEIHDISSLSSTPPSDDASKVSSDENTGGGTMSIRKEINVNQYASRFPQVNGGEDEKPSKRSKKEDVSLDVIYNNTDFKDGGGMNHRRSSEGVLAPANWKSTGRTKESLESQPRFMSVNSRKSDEINSTSAGSLDRSVNNNKLNKVKLKVGGTTRTIDANSNSSSKPHRSSDKLHGKDESDDCRPPQSDRRGGLQGVPWKDFSSGGFILGKKDPSMGKEPSRSRPIKLADSARKSRRVPKKHGAFDDDEEDDDEIRYLEKLKNSKLSMLYRDDEEESGKKHRKLSNFSRKSDELNDANVPPHSGKEGRRKSPSEDTEYEEEEEPLSDGGGEVGDKIKKRQRKESVELVTEPKKEFALTTRQRALQSGKDASTTGSSVIEFPNGLPPSSSRKQKEKLTDVELQLKKVEAAQRRKLQNEKAAKESEAEAIRKILGQDSSRKKREDKKKKRREELAQGKAADALLHSSNTVRLTMGPNGTIVTFPNEMGFPSIFNSKPISYPPPREKCAGPSCTNPYKYRDSKTKLPLCSLRCYKAVQAPLPAI